MGCGYGFMQAFILSGVKQDVGKNKETKKRKTRRGSQRIRG